MIENVNNTLDDVHAFILSRRRPLPAFAGKTSGKRLDERPAQSARIRVWCKPGAGLRGWNGEVFGVVGTLKSSGFTDVSLFPYNGNCPYEGLSLNCHRR